VRLLVGSGEGTRTPDELADRDRLPGVGVAKDGTFEATVGVHDPFLRAWHPRLATPGRAPVRVVEDAEFVVLTLVKAPLLRFAPVLPTGAAVSRGTIEVWFTAPGAARPQFRLARADDDGVAIADPPVGNFTLLFDAGGPEAPLEVKEVAIPAEGRDLGQLQFMSGAAIDIVLPPPADVAAVDGVPRLEPRVVIEAKRIETPPCARRAHGGELRHAILRGLGRGRYEVKLLRRDDLFSDAELWKQVVDFDGQGTVTVNVDLH
jgi:hypothetical protein